MCDAAGEERAGDEDAGTDADRQVVGQEGAGDGGEHHRGLAAGQRCRVRRLCQSKVAIDTKTMTATRAAMGMTATGDLGAQAHDLDRLAGPEP